MAQNTHSLSLLSFYENVIRFEIMSSRKFEN